MSVTKTQCETAAMKRIIAVADAVANTIMSTKEGVPSGQIYAMLMNHMSLNQYNRLIAALEESGRIIKRGDVLKPAPGQVMTH